MLIDFESNSDDELTVKEGDVVKNVTKASEEGWLHGELRGKKGIFPANFVQVCQGFTVHSTVYLCSSTLRATCLKYDLLGFNRRSQSI